MDLEQQHDPQRERILQEIAMCREDERSSQNMQLQIISIAGVILGALLAASFLFGNGGSASDSGGAKSIKDYLWALSLLSDLIFLTAYSYMTYLGIGNLLRYHYLQDLEVQLSKQGNPTPVFADWMGATSPVTTRNIKHLKHGYSVMHYFTYIGSALFAVVFCVLITGILYSQVETHRDWATAGFVAVITVGLFDILILLIGSTNAFKMYKWSYRQAKGQMPEKAKLYRELHMNACEEREKKKQAKEKTHKREILRGIVYYIYPKVQDAQKMFLIVMGAMYALAFHASDWQSLINDAHAHLPNFVIAFVIIELLLYAARYQLNDIRGAAEDEQANILRRERGEGNHGLPRLFASKKSDVFFSLFIAGVKFVFAVIALACLWRKELNSGKVIWNNSLAHSLSAISVLIVLATILYEYSRTVNKPKQIIFSVGFGYALRFWAGFLAICPNIAAAWEHKSLLCILFAMYFYGIMAATLPWTYYAAKEGEGKYSKPYYDYLGRFINCHPCTCGYDPNLKRRHQVFTPWNISMACCFLSFFVAIHLECALFIQPHLEIILAWIIILLFLNPLDKRCFVVWIVLDAFLFYNFVYAKEILAVFLALMLFFALATFIFLCFFFDKENGLFELLAGEGTVKWLKRNSEETEEDAHHA